MHTRQINKDPISVTLVRAEYNLALQFILAVSCSFNLCRTKKFDIDQCVVQSNKSSKPSSELKQ